VNLGDAIDSVVPCPGQTLTIYNDGNTTLQVTSIDAPSWVTLTPPPPYTIPAGGSQGICVAVDCQEGCAAVRCGTLVVNSDDPDEPAVVVDIDLDCDGDGVPDCIDNCPDDANADQADSDGDTHGDACDDCPDTVPGSPVDPDGCPPEIPGDFDRDGDVDHNDFGTFESCASGPAVPHSGTPTCQKSDFDDDEDVDQSDFGIFQRCYSGEGNPADPNCAD
jgi:hypothetical protein